MTTANRKAAEKILYEHKDNLLSKPILAAIEAALDEAEERGKLAFKTETNQDIADGKVTIGVGWDENNRAIRKLLRLDGEFIGFQGFGAGE